MSLKDKHIFVVEDNMANLAVIRTILKQAGAIVPFENWADTTLQKMLTYPYPIDLILLDLMFSDKVSGYDVFNVLQKTKGLSHIPVVAVTASDPDVEMRRAKEKGFKGFITKPINRRTFPQYLELILAGEEVWAEF